VQPLVQPASKGAARVGSLLPKKSRLASSKAFGRRQSSKPAKLVSLSASIFSNACAQVYVLSLSWIEPSSDSFS